MKDRTCTLQDEWRKWSADKHADRLFMVCPECGVFGSHVGEEEIRRHTARLQRAIREEEEDDEETQG